MKIILTIKSILNYLYNNLIDLVWTKKIRFADGTELTSAKSSGKLYDIKLLAQVVADKNWCCISNKKNLTKVNNPILYNDIFNKYKNSPSMINNVFAQSSFNGVDMNILAYQDTKFLFTKSGDKHIYLSDNIDLSNENAVIDIDTDCNTLFGWHIPSDISVQNFCLGKNTIIVIVQCENLADGGKCKAMIYNANDFSYITNINLPYRTSGSNKIFFVKDRFIFNYYTDIDGLGYSYTATIDDSLTVSEVKTLMVATGGQIGYIELFDATYDYDNDIIYFSSGSGVWFLNASKDYSNFNKDTDYFDCPDMYQYGATICYQDKKLYVMTSNNLYYTLDGGHTFTLKHTFSTGNGQPFLRYYNGTWFVVFGSLAWSPDLVVFVSPNNMNNWYNKYNLLDGSTLYSIGINDNGILFTTTYNDLYSVSLDKIVSTDTYNINGSTVTITYYLDVVSQLKIVYGTSQNTNIDTVTEYLGYNPYFVLDTTYNSENVQLPINTNLWTYMFVGDNFIDDNIPTGKYINLKTVGETVVNDNASISIDVKANKHYKFTNANITDITINSVEDSINETVIKFSTGNTAATLTDNSGIDWYDGVPVLNANSSYTIVIYDSTAYWLEK